MVVSLRSWTTHSVYESVFAQSLRLRGAEVSLLTCGGGQPVCEQGWARRAWPRPCDRCGWYTDRVARAARLRQYRIADALPWGDDARNAPPAPPPVPAGPDPHRAAKVSSAWTLRTTDVEVDPRVPAIKQDFSVAADGVAASTERALDDFRPDTVLLLNGLFAAERVIRELALARGLRVVTYEIAPRENALVFSADAPAPLCDLDAPWARWRHRPLSAGQHSAITKMLAARSEGRAAHERYHDDPLAEPDRVRAALDLPPAARLISLFTSLTWESTAVHRDLGFDSMFSWIDEAVGAVSELSDSVLVIRVHPAEARHGSSDPVMETLGDLPGNVRVVGPEQSLSSYGLLALSDLALVYQTTLGLEAAATGTPVAVAGDAHYRGRGFTYDLESPEALRTLLRAGRWSISDEQIQLALRYAYLFFFRFMIPLRVVPLKQALPSGAPDDVSAIRAGANPYLDFVIDRILDGEDFILPDALAAAEGA